MPFVADVMAVPRRARSGRWIPCRATFSKDPRETKRYIAIPPIFGPPKAGVGMPILILSPLLVDLRELRGYVAIPHTLGPCEGRDEVASSDFVPFSGVPPEAQVLRSRSAHFRGPEKAGAM